MASKKYIKRLRKLKALACDEVIDGCPECCHLEREKQKAGIICYECRKKCIEIITNPRKSLGLSGFLT